MTTLHPNLVVFCCFVIFFLVFTGPVASSVSCVPAVTDDFLKSASLSGEAAPLLDLLSPFEARASEGVFPSGFTTLSLSRSLLFLKECEKCLGKSVGDFLNHHVHGLRLVHGSVQNDLCKAGLRGAITPGS